jgi:branched-chain amino acid transport system ATP-binding protein
MKAAATSPPDTALEVAGLAKSFGGIRAVAGVDFAIGRREIVGVIGPNGSGKSTLFNLIAGGIAPDAGRVVLDGREVTGLGAWRIARAGLGRTFQIPSLFDNLTARENLLAAAVEGDWRGAPARAQEALELLQIEQVADQLASELSGGQQKLLEFGRVYMRAPRLVLLDEVTAGVHYSIRRILLGALTRLRAAGATFLVIEHDMELIQEICERILVMHQGELVASGTFEEVAQDHEVQQAYLGRRA